MRLETRIKFKRVTSELLKQRHEQVMATSKWLHMPFEQKQEKLFNYKMLLNTVLWFEMTGECILDEFIPDAQIAEIAAIEREISQKVECEMAAVLANQGKKPKFNPKNNMNHLF